MFRNSSQYSINYITLPIKLGCQFGNQFFQQVCFNFAPIFLISTNDSLGIAGSITNTPDKTVLVKYFYPNNLGLYNMSGNAAEMLSDRNIVKGGSWSDKSEFMKISSKQEYDGSAKRTVGFRYFLEIIEK